MKSIQCIYMLALTLYSATIYSSIETAASCINGIADTYNCSKLDLEAHISLDKLQGHPTDANDIWGYVDLNNNREYALIGTRKGTNIIDVTDPSNPIEIEYIPGQNSSHRDIKVLQVLNDSGSYEAYAYVVTEADNGGLQVIDLTNLPQSARLVRTKNDFGHAHNITITNIDYETGLALSGQTPYLYIVGTDDPHVYSLDNPANPSGIESIIGSDTHDAVGLTIDDERVSQCPSGQKECELLITFDGDFISIWDVTFQSNPQFISRLSYDNLGYVHSGWPSADGQYVFIQDELDELNFNLNTTLRTLDISDLTSPNISNVYSDNSTGIDHNGFTKNNRYYMSNYADGVVVFDVSNPNDPFKIGFFDTSPTNLANEGFYGVWGVYPYLPSGTLLLSDIESGLYVLSDNTVLGEEIDPDAQLGDNGNSDSQRSFGQDSSGSSGGGSITYFFLSFLVLVRLFRRWPRTFI